MHSFKPESPTASAAPATPRAALAPEITRIPAILPTQQPISQPIPLRPARHLRRNLLLDLPIATRLTLGFLVAGLIAALIPGIIGMQRTQSLSRQSEFYQILLHTNTSLTTGANFLQLMNTETHTLLSDASAPSPSQETLSLDRKAIDNLSLQYDAILSNYIARDLLSRNPDQSALLAEANHSIQVVQQQTLAGSTLRAWKVYEAAQALILQDVKANDLAEAQTFERTQTELTSADALSAIRSLIQFDGKLAASVHDAAAVEEQGQLITTTVGAIMAFICIALVGLFISNTLVQRLRALHQVTQAVEQGQIDARATVIGRDEIADVSASVNGMLETITGLLGETRSQRDALTNAAAHLFSEMRIVSAGDLRGNAPVSDDPIGLLANAFNFTVGRFRRFVLRTQTATDQLEVLSRQELERTEQFLKAMNSQLPAQPPSSSMTTSAIAGTPRPPSKRPLSGNLAARQEVSTIPNTPSAMDEFQRSLQAQMRLTREHLQSLQGSSDPRQVQVLLSLVEQFPPSLERLTRLMRTEAQSHNRPSSSSITQGYVQELQMLHTTARRMTNGLQQTQQTQQAATHALAELTADVTQLTTLAQRLTQKSETPAAKETGQDAAQLSLAFAQEMTILARHMTKVAQEMRSSVISFQLDSADGLR